METFKTTRGLLLLRLPLHNPLTFLTWSLLTFLTWRPRHSTAETRTGMCVGVECVWGGGVEGVLRISMCVCGCVFEGACV